MIEVTLGLVVAIVAGCGESAPPPTDLSEAPWLNPQAQIEGLKSSDYRVRGLSAFHLGNLGAAAVTAVPELERLAKHDANEKVRENAADALEKIRAATGTSGE